MHRLVLTEDLSRALVGALLAVGRADGELGPGEIEALRASSEALAPDLVVDDEWLLGTQITPEDLAAAVVAGSGAFRTAASSSRQEIAEVFVDLALGIADADGFTGEVEAIAIRTFAEVLGASGPTLGRVDQILVALRGEGGDDQPA